MTWLAWRQHQRIVLVGAVLLAALGVWMAWVAHGYRLAPAVGCTGTGCAPVQATAIRFALLVLPVVIGLAFGPGLVANDLEQHTAVIAFTQSRTRLRWLASRWLLLAGLVTLSMSVGAVVAAWWNGVVGPSFEPRIQPGTFDLLGLVPVAYAVFAFSLGAFLGAALRRASAAGILTLVLYAVIRSVVDVVVRPVLVSQRFQRLTALFPTGQVRDRWYLGYAARNADGVVHRIPAPSSLSCTGRDPAHEVCSIPGVHGGQFGRLYLPGSDFWTLQWREAGLYLLASLLLLALTVWCVRRWRA